jgi:hypothetical protein
MITQIRNLFEQIGEYEGNPSSLQERVFEKDFREVIEYFEIVKDQPQQIQTIDQSLLEAVQRTPLDRSGLRFLTSHLLTTIFDYSVRATHRREAYLYCIRQRKTKNDSEFLIHELAPKLFKSDNLEKNHGIRDRILHHICILQKLGGYQNPLHEDMPLNRISSISSSEVMLGLFHRLMDSFKSGRQRLISHRGSIEYRLAQSGFFEQLAQVNHVYREFLLKWGYISEEASWMERFSAFIKNRARWFFGNIGSIRFLFYNLTKEKSAFIFYPLLILLFLALSILVTKKWIGYSDQKNQEFQMSQPEKSP